MAYLNKLHVWYELRKHGSARGLLLAVATGFTWRHRSPQEHLPVCTTRYEAPNVSHLRMQSSSHKRVICVCVVS